MILSRIPRLARKVMIAATLALVVGSASPVHARGWWGGGRHGGSSGGGVSGVPEIDAGSAAGAMTLLVGGIMLMRDRFAARRRSRK